MRCKWSFWLPLGMMVAFAITCWPAMLPERMKNFSAAYAIAFCAGVYFPGRMGWILPLGTLLVLDFCLNVFYYNTSPLSPFTVFKVAAYAGIIWLGTKFRGHRSWFKLVGGGILGALIFYVVTNIASWIFDPGYPKSIGGLLQALTVGIPGYPPTWLFLKNTLISGGLFTGLFAGVMNLSEAAEEVEEKEEERGEQPVPEEA
ncbi:MAG: DUF6580 family putative transport protein [Limisphaerales bacterium]